MRFNNKTSYHNTAFKSLFVDICKEEGVVHKGYDVTVVYARKNCVTGRASYTRPRITICVPHNEVKVGQLIDVFRHELMHTLGVGHEREGLMSAHYDEKDYANDTEVIKEEVAE